MSEGHETEYDRMVPGGRFPLTTLVGTLLAGILMLGVLAFLASVSTGSDPSRAATVLSRIAIPVFSVAVIYTLLQFRSDRETAEESGGDSDV